MRTTALLFAALLLPSAAHAYRLLDGPGLNLNRMAFGQTLPPPPPENPPPPPSTADQPEGPMPADQPAGAMPSAHPPEEGGSSGDEIPSDVPSIGSILGFMITGGALTVVGASLILEGIIFLTGGASCASTTTIDCNALSGSGIVLLIFGIPGPAIGIPLLVIGNNKRKARNRYMEENHITWKQPLHPYVPLWSFNF